MLSFKNEKIKLAKEKNNFSCEQTKASLQGVTLLLFSQDTLHQQPFPFLIILFL